MADEILRWVKIVVLRTMREKNLSHLDTDLLISAGLFGYSQARDRFDPGREVKFKTFAEYRIKGAVLDEVRKIIGDERCKTPRPRQVDFNFDLMGDGGVIADHLNSNLDVDIFFKDAPVSDRDKKILRCRADGMNLKEIGAAFGFSESRASQVLAKIRRDIYPWLQTHFGAKFKLVTYDCGECGHPNEASENAIDLDCEMCGDKVSAELPKKD